MADIVGEQERERERLAENEQTSVSVLEASPCLIRHFLTANDREQAADRARSQPIRSPRSITPNYTALYAIWYSYTYSMPSHIVPLACAPYVFQRAPYAEGSIFRRIGRWAALSHPWAYFLAVYIRLSISFAIGMGAWRGRWRRGAWRRRFLDEMAFRRRYKIRVPTRRYFSQSVVFQAVHTVTLDLIHPWCRKKNKTKTKCVTMKLLLWSLTMVRIPHRTDYRLGFC